MARMCGMKEEEGAAAPGYEKCLNEDITLNIGAKKMVRQETEDSAFSDSPILRNWTQRTEKLLCIIREAI